MCCCKITDLNKNTNTFVRTAVFLLFSFINYSNEFPADNLMEEFSRHEEGENNLFLNISVLNSTTTVNAKRYNTINQKISSRKLSLLEHKVMDSNNNDYENNFNANSTLESTQDVLDTSIIYFKTANSSVVTTQVGAIAHIPCSVHHIREGMVSWIRKKDYHLLTVGLTTYSSDERFSATHLKYSEDWTLQIKYVQKRDAGVYECQISTHPPTSIFLHLAVVEARAEISGPSIRFITPGSMLRLQCQVVQNTESSEFIFWYHDNRMINYDTDRGINVSSDADFQSSELIISMARREHSGNYTCVASNSQPASVLVHIFKGDNPAAMYHGDVGISTKTCQMRVPFIVMLLTLSYKAYVRKKLCI